MNAYETEAMQELLVRNGYEIVPFQEKADIYIINTCTVTNMADRKSRQMLHRARKQNPEALVVACGCYVQAKEGEQEECVDVVIGNNRKKDLIEILEGFESGKKRLEKEILDINHTNEYEELHLEQTAEHTRAYVKVQDGCNQFCTYCIIPYVRGRVRSRARDSVLGEIQKLADNGYKEAVLTGIHLSSYGIDTNDSLLGLILAVHEIPGIQRIRLGSLEPRIITQEFVETLAELPKICPHFHLSLQSGCDATLKRMNRKYDTARFYESVDLLRKHFDRPAVTTDMIVGFPGETEEEFSATLDFVRQCAFAEMHVFPYSIRTGTPAAEMAQVPGPVKEERAGRAGALAARLHREYLDRCAGRVFDVLYEQGGDGLCRGHAPNYMAVAVRGEAAALHNRVLPTRITGVEDGLLLGELAER